MKIFLYLLALVAFQCTPSIAHVKEIKPIPSSGFADVRSLKKFYGLDDLDHSVEKFDLGGEDFYGCVRDAAKGGALQEVAIFAHDGFRWKPVLVVPFQLNQFEIVGKEDHLVVEVWDSVSKKRIEFLRYTPKANRKRAALPLGKWETKKDDPDWHEKPTKDKNKRPKSKPSGNKTK